MTASQIAAGFRAEAERLATEADRYRAVADVLDPAEREALAQTATPGLVGEPLPFEVARAARADQQEDK